jgi:hypothetical protein
VFSSELSGKLLKFLTSIPKIVKIQSEKSELLFDENNINLKNINENIGIKDKEVEIEGDINEVLIKLEQVSHKVNRAFSMKTVPIESMEVDFIKVRMFIL